MVIEDWMMCFLFGKLKKEQNKIKQELYQREEEIKGGDGV